MSVGQLSAAELCRALAAGWSEDRADLPRELLARLTTRWQASLSSPGAGSSIYRARLDVHRVHFRGAAQLGCLVLGHGAVADVAVPEFLRQYSGAGTLALVLAVSSALLEQARRVPPTNTFVLVGSDDIETMLTHTHPLELLKEIIRRQIPLHRLLPFDIMHPAAPNMFFGRRDLLNRLHHEDTTNFAIAGPGRIGKSSLLHQYRQELVRQGDSRVHGVYIIDCYTFWALGPDELARALAMAVGGDSRADAVRATTLPKYLTFHFNKRTDKKPIELLLDEVDGVCDSTAFDELADAVRNGVCRVVMCGKSRLYATMTKRKSHFSKRLELIRPEPLDVEAAGRLLLEPLGDLGIVPLNPDETRQTIFELSARRPHLIQECAKLLFQILLASETRTITPEHLVRLREKFMERASAMLPLESLQNDVTRLLTLVWLREGGGPISVGSLQKSAEILGVPLNAVDALAICDDLWISNILTWEHGVLQLASPQLVEFVRRMDFDQEIAALRKAVLASVRGQN